MGTEQKPFVMDEINVTNPTNQNYLVDAFNVGDLHEVVPGQASVEDLTVKTHETKFFAFDIPYSEKDPIPPSSIECHNGN